MSPDLPSFIREYCQRFMYDPLAWVYWAFPWGEGELAGHAGPEDWQVRLLSEVGRGLRGLGGGGLVQAAVSSGHGVGKSAAVAWLVMWWLSTRLMAKGSVTANTGDQLRTKTWPELRKWWQLCAVRDWFDVSATRIAVQFDPERWFMSAVTWSEERPEAIAGEQGPYTLVIQDEASVVPPIIDQTIRGGFATGQNLFVKFGNPTRNSGSFFDCFHRDRSRWITLTVDSRTVRRPGVNLDIHHQLAEQYGEDHDITRVRVRGQFPRQSAMQFISSEVVAAARQRAIGPDAYAHAPVILSADIAAGGDDRTVVGHRQGIKLHTPILRYNERDTMLTAARLITRIDQLQPHLVVIDGNSWGRGVLDQCRSQRYEVRNVWEAQAFYDAQRKAARKGRAMTAGNFTAWLWAQMADWLEEADIPDDDDLDRDLTGREYFVDEKSGLLVLERKDAMRQRGLPSPDNADMLAQTFAFPVSAAAVGTRRGKTVVANTRFSPYG